MGKLSDRPIVFGAKAVERITTAVKRIEKMPYPSDQFMAQRATLWLPVTEGIVTTAITACSTLTYGTGAVQPYIDNGMGTAIADPGFPNPVTVLNFLTGTGTIAIGKHVYIFWRNNGWRLLTGDC